MQGFNAQIAVDSASQVIVAAEVTQATNATLQLVPKSAQIERNLEQKPEKVSADTGYFSETNADLMSTVKDVDLYVATGRDKHSAAWRGRSSDPPPPDASPKEAMRHKLRTADGRAVYKMRKAIVEPVFRTDQGTARFSSLQLAWQTECSPRMETGVHGQQPAEAVPSRVGSGNGMRRREMGAFYPKMHRRLATSCQQDYRPRATVR